MQKERNYKMKHKRNKQHYNDHQISGELFYYVVGFSVVAKQWL